MFMNISLLSYRTYKILSLMYNIRKIFSSMHVKVELTYMEDVIEDSQNLK